MTKKNAKSDSNDRGGNQSVSSFGQHIPPPPPPPAEEPPQIIPDVGLNISPSLHARYDQLRAEKKAAQAPAAARISRPGAGAGSQHYQRAKSARVLPTAPPPPPPPSAAGFGNKSIAAIGGGTGLSMSLHAPAASNRPLGRAASARVVSPAASSRSLGRASSTRGVAPPPPPPPPPPSAPPPPPTSAPPQPEDLLSAEVPLVAGKATLPAVSESAEDSKAPPPPPPQEKPKKSKKKKEETPPEIFQDELEDVSESEAEEELSAEEKAEKTEKEVRKTLFFAVLNACGMIFLISLISKLCQRFSDAEYAGEDELLNAAGTNVAGPVPPPTGVETAVAQNMAVAASQGAAASTAAGTTSAATVAAAAASTAAVTSVTSSASVVGVSAVAVTGVGMATGVVPVPDFLWASQHPCHVFLDELTPHRGHVNLHMKNLPRNFFIPENTPAIEKAFADAFNKVLGTCVAHSVEGHNDTDTNSTEADEISRDIYARFLQNATLDDWDVWSAFDSETGKQVQYFTTEWVAFVGCDDKDGESRACSELEPLFYDGDREQGQGLNLEAGNEGQVDMTRRHLTAIDPYVRWLQDTNLLNGENQRRLQLFMDSFELELQDLLASIPDGQGLKPDIFFAASLAANDTHRIIETEGVKYQSGHLLAGKGSGDAVDRPHGLPICSLPNGNPIPTLELKEGYVHIGLQGVEEAFFANAEQLMRDAFRSVYNDLMLGCEGDYSRVLEKVELTGLSGWTEQGQHLLSTNWTGVVSCDGCPDIEPLFLVQGGGNSKASSSSRGGRNLEISSDEQLAQFANNFAAEISKLYQTQKPGATVEAYYAASVDEEGAIVGNAVGELQPFATKHDGLVDCATMQPPVSVDDLGEGHFELYIKDLVKDMNKDILGAAMRDVYNDITGMCDGPLQRVAHRVAIDSSEQVIIDDSEVYVAMNMTAKLTCTGCYELDEFMFDGGEQGAARRILQQTPDEELFEHFRSKLSTQINLLLTNFEQTPYYYEGASLFDFTNPEGPHKPVTVVYGATFDRNGRVTRYGTPVQSHNIFAPSEGLVAGSDVIVDVETCEKDLVLADAIPRDHGLTKEEYFVFVRELFPDVLPLQTWPLQLGGYDKLPVEVQETFDKFQQGGRMQFGEKNAAANVAREEQRRIHVEAICYFTSHAIRDSIVGITLAPTEPPTSRAPSTAPPTTGAPTTLPPTLAPTTIAPSAAPSVSPTETREVEINVEWRFRMSPDNRDATQQEYVDFTERVSDWMSETMGQAYAANATLNFESQTTTFTTSKYEPANQDYSIVAITKSAFIFRGEQPTAKSVFEVLNEQDLEPLLRSLWVNPDEDPNPWIFDNAVGLTLATALDR